MNDLFKKTFVLTHITPPVSFYNPLKTSEKKTRGFLMFSRDIEKDQWHKLDKTWFMLSHINRLIFSEMQYYWINVCSYVDFLIKLQAYDRYTGNFLNFLELQYLYERPHLGLTSMYFSTFSFNVNRKTKKTCKRSHLWRTSSFYSEITKVQNASWRTSWRSRRGDKNKITALRRLENWWEHHSVGASSYS